jgi:hypothetical protein
MTDSSATADRLARWSEFLKWPAPTMDGARLDACFDNEFGIALCDRLKASVRLQDRLASVVGTHYALNPSIDPVALGEIDQAIVLLSGRQLAAVARRSGAIYWANTIANVILAPQVEALHQQIGEEFCNFALAHRDLAGSESAVGSFKDIGERIIADGWRCLAAWGHVLPAGLGMRVRLKLPATAELDAVPAPPFLEIGPPIVRRAAGADGANV